SSCRSGRRARPRGPPGWAPLPLSRRGTTPRTRPRGRRPTSLVRAERERDPAFVRLAVPLDVDRTGDALADEPAGAADEKGLGEAGHAPLPDGRSLAVVDDRVRDAVALHEAARVLAEVVDVHAEHDEAPVAAALGRLLGAGGSDPTRRH